MTVQRPVLVQCKDSLFAPCIYFSKFNSAITNMSLGRMFLAGWHCPILLSYTAHFVDLSNILPV